MIRRPPRSTRTDTLFPDTPLFRSSGVIRIMSSVTRPRLPKPAAPTPVKLETRSPSRPAATLPITAPNEKQTMRTRSPSRVSRSEEHTSELQSLMRISYDVFCLKKKDYEIKTVRNTCVRETED